MDSSQLLRHVDVESAALRASAGRDLDSPVPSCPGWSVRDLVRHVAEVYEHKLACIALAGPKPEPWPPSWPADRDPLEWFDDARARLIEVLESVDPAAPSWTWLPEDQSAGFWHRRMAHESAIHRVDAELAAGEASPVGAALAIDGIDELLDLMLAGDWTGDEEPELVGTVGLRAGSRTWVVTMTADQVTVVASGPEPEGTVSGDPSALLLWLYGRAPDEVVEVEGTSEVVSRLRRRVALATQ